MGIKNLFSELKKRGLEWKSMRLTPEQVRALPPQRRTIVLDGCSLIGPICFVDGLYGGRYNFMQQKVNDMVKQYAQFGFKLLVVVDGSLDKAKLGTWMNRRMVELKELATLPQIFSKINSGGKIPRSFKLTMGGMKSLALELFRNAGCDVSMSAGEADREVAQLCLERGCYGVVSNDSDFLAFGVPMLIQSGSVTFQGKNMSFKCYSLNDVCETLGLTKDFLPLFGTLIGNDFVPLTELKRFHDSIASGPSPKLGGPRVFSDVLVFLSDERRAFRLRPDNIEEWVQSLSTLPPAAKKLILQSLNQYLPKKRLELISEKGGLFCANTLALWEYYQSEYGVTNEKLMIQILCDHGFYESPCTEMGMPVSVWEITREMRHRLYELILGPIRATKPVIQELSISPLLSGSTPGRKPCDHTLDFSFVDRERITFSPDQPLTMFVFSIQLCLAYALK